MQPSTTGPTGPPRTPAPRTPARRRADPDHQATPNDQATPNSDREATSRRGRLAAEALRWACHVAGLVVGPAGPSSIAGRSIAGLRKQLSRGAAETAVRVTLEALAAAGRELVERPSRGQRRRRFCPYEKALGALDFSLRAGFGSLAVPSKLVGVREHQGAIRRLKASGARFGTALRLTECDGRHDGRLGVATADGEPLGLVQPKHEGWLRALLVEAGPGTVSVALLGVTGDGEGGRLHGVNVAFCGLAPETCDSVLHTPI